MHAKYPVTLCSRSQYCIAGTYLAARPRCSSTPLWASSYCTTSCKALPCSSCTPTRAQEPVLPAPPPLLPLLQENGAKSPGCWRRCALAAVANCSTSPGGLGPSTRTCTGWKNHANDSSICKVCAQASLAATAHDAVHEVPPELQQKWLEVHLWPVHVHAGCRDRQPQAACRYKGSRVVLSPTCTASLWCSERERLRS